MAMALGDNLSGELLFLGRPGRRVRISEVFLLQEASLLGHMLHRSLGRGVGRVHLM
jgi:hypothetical protein